LTNDSSERKRVVAGRALVLAAHGSGDESATNDLARATADRLHQSGRFDEVTAAFHLGEPSFRNVLDGLSCSDVVVVPLMTSEGFYYDTLPAALTCNDRFEKLRVRLTRPVGTSDRLHDLVAARCAELIRRFDLAPAESAVIVVGHGTTRHRRSRQAAWDLAASLARANVAARIEAGFLDDAPRIEALAPQDDGLARLDWIVVPFLIGGGRHASVDVGARLGLNGNSHAAPSLHNDNGRNIVIDAPVGCYPELPDVITAMAEEVAA